VRKSADIATVAVTMMSGPASSGDEDERSRPGTSEAIGAEEDRGTAAVGGLRMPASPLFRPSNLRCVNTLSGHHSGIRAIAWRSNPQRVYTGSYDNTIKVWNLDTNTCETTLEGHQAWVRSLFCSLHEPLLFSGSDDGEVKIWRTDNNTLHTGIEPSGAGGVLALTVDYERAWLLAGCYDSSIHVWQLPSCELLHVLHGHRSAVKALEIFNGCLLSGRCAYGEHDCFLFIFLSLRAHSHHPFCAQLRSHDQTLGPRRRVQMRRLARDARLRLGVDGPRGHAPRRGRRQFDQGLADGHLGADLHAVRSPRAGPRARVLWRSADKRLGRPVHPRVADGLVGVREDTHGT